MSACPPWSARRAHQAGYDEVVIEGDGLALEMARVESGDDAEDDEEEDAEDGNDGDAARGQGASDGHAPCCTAVGRQRGGTDEGRPGPRLRPARGIMSWLGQRGTMQVKNSRASPGAETRARRRGRAATPVHTCVCHSATGQDETAISRSKPHGRVGCMASWRVAVVGLVGPGWSYGGPSYGSAHLAPSRWVARTRGGRGKAVSARGKKRTGVSCIVLHLHPSALCVCFCVCSVCACVCLRACVRVRVGV